VLNFDLLTCFFTEWWRNALL